MGDNLNCSKRWETTSIFRKNWRQPILFLKMGDKKVLSFPSSTSSLGDNQHFLKNGREPQFFEKRRSISILKVKEDDCKC
jgi:hypothetical protein